MMAEVGAVSGSQIRHVNIDGDVQPTAYMMSIMSTAPASVAVHTSPNHYSSASRGVTNYLPFDAVPP